MSSTKRSLGRFSSRYGDLPSPKFSEQVVGLINSDTPFTDLAAADLGRIRISCWLEPETLSWGRHKGTPAAIVPVQIKAERPPGCKLTDFSLDLQLLPARRLVCSRNSSQHEVLSEDPGPKSFPHLVKIPSPERVSGSRPVPLDQASTAGSSSLVLRDVERWVTYQSGNWVFRSGCIADRMGRPVTARWTYEASPFPSGDRDHKPFHGAMALFHDEQDFEVKCSVIGNSTRSRLRLKFGGQTCQPRFWRVKPQPCEDDLKSNIEILENRMVHLNLIPSMEETHDPISFEAVSARLKATLIDQITDQSGTVHVGHEFGPSSISGSATVFMGDVSINYR